MGISHPSGDKLAGCLAIGTQLAFFGFFLWVFEGRTDLLIEAHDAKFYLDQVTDPFLMSAATVADWGDITYWGLRIGFPLLGWPFQFFLGPFEALFLVHTAAAVVGSLWAGRLAEANGKPAWWGLALAINPASMFAAALLLPDVVAYTAVVGVLLFASRRRWVIATLLAILAVATKEASLAPLAAMAGWYFWKGEKRASWVVGAPLVWHVGWGLVLSSRFGAPHSATFIDWPLVGLWEAFHRVWQLDAGIHPAAFVALGMVLLSVVAIVAFLRRPTPVMAAAAGAGAIYFFMSWQVLYPISNLPRIGGWLFPLLAIGWNPNASIGWKYNAGPDLPSKDAASSLG